MTRTPSSTGGLAECGVINELWESLEGLLHRGTATVQHAISFMQASLPHLGELERKELCRLAQLHMDSAANLMKTLRLLLPHVFHEGDASPNGDLFLQLEGSHLELAGMLIDLQLFHMQRAAQLVAHARGRLEASQKQE